MLLGFVTNCQRLGGLNHKHFFPTVLEAGESKARVPAGVVSGESLLPSSQMTVFLLCPRMPERAKELPGVFDKGTNSMLKGSAPMT